MLLCKKIKITSMESRTRQKPSLLGIFILFGVLISYIGLNGTSSGAGVYVHDDFPSIFDPAIQGLRPEMEIEPSNGLSNPNYTVLDIRGASLSVAEQLLLASVEGIVNQDEALLYIIQDDQPGYYQNDVDWLADMATHPLRNGTNMAFSGMAALINNFSMYFDNIIIVDETDTHMWNVASPLAGYHDALIVCEAMYSSLVPQLNKSYPVVYNFTSIFEQNVLQTAQEKYAYAYAHYFQFCNQDALGVFMSAHPGYMRAFLIARSIFTIWDEFLPIFDVILAETKPNIPVYGCWTLGGDNTEGKLVSRLSEHGKYIHVAEYMHNMAFLSRFPLPANYTFSQHRGDPLPSLENKVYVSGIVSDGDNLQYVQGFMRNRLWNDPNRGVYPVGWSISPMLVEEMPYLIKYYYDTASNNDLMVSGLNGKGYVYPELMDRTVLNAYIADSEVQLEALDMREMTMMKAGQTLELYSHLDVTGFFTGYGYSEYKFSREVNGIPVLFNLKVGYEWEKARDIIWHVQEVNPQRPIFINLHLICWKCNVTEWTMLAGALDSTEGIEVVRPDQLALLMARANLQPHVVAQVANYTVLGIIIIAVIATSRKIGKSRSGNGESTGGGTQHG